MRRSAAFGVILLALASSVFGQDAEFEKFLVPIVIHEPLPGGYGSLWTSTVLVRNHGDEPIVINGDNGFCTGLLCPNARTVPPHTTVEAQALGAENGRGALLSVWSEQAGDVSFSLRIRDLSRQDLTWGTEIPVIRESDLEDGAITLIGIPVAERFRTMLRIYELAIPPSGSTARVRIYSAGDLRRPVGPDDLLGEAVVALSPPTPGRQWAAPGYAEVADLRTLAVFAEASLLAIEIEPTAPDQRLWAFVSVTNNETQHVTTITPQ